VVSTYKSLVGFVPQDDIMHRDLTVNENLKLYALLRLPKKMSHKDKCNVLEEVIHILGLSNIRDEIIGDEVTRGISGGQCKRVSS
jgi:ABC-type multidrug transport system ATPase subunit